MCIFVCMYVIYMHKIAKKIPGPGAYHPKVGIDPSGVYIEARMKNT